VLTNKHSNPTSRSKSQSRNVIISFDPRPEEDDFAARLIESDKVDINAVSTEICGPMFLATKAVRMSVIQGGSATTTEIGGLGRTQERQGVPSTHEYRAIGTE
jgi:hypothetical protein